LALRQSIAVDWPIRAVVDGAEPVVPNPWVVLFKRLEQEHSPQKYKHGLYPDWIYECRDPSRTVRITRHLAHFKMSRDEATYASLKLGLSLYRLVFGQADQEALLADLEARLEGRSSDEQLTARRRLASYMLNLSPIGRPEARRFANTEAKILIDAEDSAGLSLLLANVATLLTEHAHELTAVRESVDRLCERVAQHLSGQSVPRHLLLKAVTVLAYLRNPYDEFFDNQAAGGFDDDIAMFRQAERFGSV